MIKGIKHIIFDLGGVILNIDYPLTSQAFKQLGVNNFDAVYSQAKQTSLFDDFETGKISPEKFVVQVKNLLDIKCTDDEIITSWNAMLLDFPKERLDLLQQLKNKYTIVLLSNTRMIN